MIYGMFYFYDIYYFICVWAVDTQSPKVAVPDTRPCDGGVSASREDHFVFFVIGLFKTRICEDHKDLFPTEVITLLPQFSRRTNHSSLLS